jgi:hypothetical protein
MESDRNGKTHWETNGGIHTTIIKILFPLPELAPSCNFQHIFKLDELHEDSYDIIIGQDLIRTMKLDMTF